MRNCARLWCSMCRLSARGPVTGLISCGQPTLLPVALPNAPPGAFRNIFLAVYLQTCFYWAYRRSPKSDEVVGRKPSPTRPEPCLLGSETHAASRLCYFDGVF